MTKPDGELRAIRLRIDEIDRELLRLVNDRASLAVEAARIKEREGGGAGYYRPEREATLRRALLELNAGPLSDEEVTRLFVEIVSACRALEQPMRIGYLGPEGTFTEAAVQRHFGRSVRSIPLGSIDAVFREVESGACHFGIVPVENSTEGVVNHTLDMFLQSDLAIAGEVQLRIHHHLLGSSSSLAEIEKIYSHQQSFAQCRKWLQAHLPGIDREAVSSNAEAARRAKSEPRAAAVAGKIAAETYGLQAIASNIEDEPNNTTRFLVIGTHVAGPSGGDKTSLLLSVKNRPGALYGLLEPFSRHRINLTKIESRPSRGRLWEYVFFVDIEGHRSEDNVRAALAEIEEHAAFVKVLGSYPRATS